MTQYDAGPGEWSDRPWEDPEKKPKPQARRKRLTLPPWALLAIVVALVILLCVLLVLIVRAIRGGGDQEQATPPTTVTVAMTPTATISLVTPTPGVTPTATVVLPGATPEETPGPDEIAPGAMVIVTGTAGAGLNLRQQPSTYAKVVVNAKEGTVLTVLEGPKEADDYVWWRVRAPDGTEGWAAANWLELKTEE
jgi:hypothetical protein